MPPLSRFLSFLFRTVCMILMFAILYTRRNPLANAILIAGAIVLTLLLPYVFVEETGWFFAADLRRYKMALALLKISLFASSLPGLKWIYALCLAETAQIFLWSGDREAARAFANKAGQILFDTQIVEYATMSRCGHVFYSLGDFDRAKKYLTAALKFKDAHVSRLNRTKALKFPKVMNFFGAEKIEMLGQDDDLLAKIALKDNDFHQAEKYFTRASNLFSEVWYFKSNAAYDANARGSVLLFSNSDTDECISLIMEAANSMPEKVSLPIDVRLAVDIVHNLRLLKTEEASLAADALLKKCIDKMHDSQKEYLNVLVTP